MIPDADTILDGVRTLLFRVWTAVNRRGNIPKSDLEECFLSFGLLEPVCELHRKQPDLSIILKELEVIESSLMGVGSW